MKKILILFVLIFSSTHLAKAEKVNIYDFQFPDRKPDEFKLFEKLISFKPNDYGYNNEENLKKAIKNIPFLCRSSSYSGYASLADTSVLDGMKEILMNANKKLYEFNFRFPKNCKNSGIGGGVRLMPLIKSKKIIFSKTYLSAVWVNRKKFLNANVPEHRRMNGFPHYDIFLYRFLNIPIDEKIKERLLKALRKCSPSSCQNQKAFASIIKILDNNVKSSITVKKKKTKIDKKETTKKVEKKTTPTTISPKLKLIEDMYKSGALTKEEYDAAKKRATQ